MEGEGEEGGERGLHEGARRGLHSRTRHCTPSSVLLCPPAPAPGVETHHQRSLCFRIRHRCHGSSGYWKTKKEHGCCGRASGTAGRDTYATQVLVLIRAISLTQSKSGPSQQCSAMQPLCVSSLPCKEFLLHILLCQVLRRSRRASGTMRWQLCGRRDDGIGPTSGQVRHAVALYPVVADGDEWRRRLDARHDSAGAIP